MEPVKSDNALDKGGERFLVYVVGVGANLLPSYVYLFSPLFAYVILKMYDYVGKADKAWLKKLLGILVIWIVITTRYNHFIAFFFNTVLASTLVGLCIAKILEEKKRTGLLVAYACSVAVAIISSCLSIKYAFYFPDLSWRIQPIIIDRFMDIWYNSWFFLGLLVSIFIGLTQANKKNNYVFGYVIAFSILLAVVWLHIHAYFKPYPYQIRFLDGH